jgi:hypothetical protein
MSTWDKKKSTDIFITAEACPSAKIRKLADYWEKLRGGNQFPSRHAIDPAEIKVLLPIIVLVELHLDPLRIRYRVAGTRFVEAFGAETSGRWLHDVYTDEYELNQTLNNFQRLLDQRTPVYGRTENTFLPIGTSQFAWAIFPLSDDGEHITHALGIEDYKALRADFHPLLI